MEKCLTAQDVVRKIELEIEELFLIYEINYKVIAEQTLMITVLQNAAEIIGRDESEEPKYSALDVDELIDDVRYAVTTNISNLFEVLGLMEWEGILAKVAFVDSEEN